MLQGSLTIVTVPSLLQLLASEARDGQLELQRSDEIASLWLEGGRIVHADGPATSPEQAAQDCLFWQDGSFEFHPGVTAPARTLDVPAEQLLLEAACRRDDENRSDPEPGPGRVPNFAPVRSGESTPRFDTLQWRVLASVDGRRTVEQVARQAELPLPAVQSVLGELARAGVVELDGGLTKRHGPLE